MLHASKLTLRFKFIRSINKYPFIIAYRKYQTKQKTSYRDEDQKRVHLQTLEMMKKGLHDKIVPFYMDLLKEGFKPTGANITIFLKNLAREDFERAKKFVLYEMENEYNIKINNKILGILIDSCTQNGNLDDALEILEETKKRNFQIDRRSYTSIIDGYVRLNNLEEAHKYLKLMFDLNIRPNVVTYNTLINGYAIQRKWDKVEELLKEMNDFNIQMDVATYSILIKNYTETNRLEFAIKTFEEFKKTNLTPSIILYHSMIKAYLKNKRPEEALKEFQEMKSFFQPDVKVYNVLIQGFCKMRRMDDALEIFNEMHETCTPDKYTFNDMINGYMNINDINGAFEFFNKMIHEYQIEPDEAIFTTLIKGCLKAGMDKKANSLLTMMKKTYNIKPDRYLKDIIMKHSLMENIKNVKKIKSPDLNTYQVMIEVFISKGELERAMHYLRELEKNNIIPKMGTYDYLIKSCYKLGNVKLGDKIYDEVYRKYNFIPTMFTFQKKIDYLCSKEEIDDALKVLVHMKKIGVTRHFDCYKPIIEYYIFYNKYDELKKILEDMNNEKFELDSKEKEFMNEVEEILQKNVSQNF